MTETFIGKNRTLWLRQVQSDPAVSPPAFLLAFVLSRFMDEDSGEAWPSQSTLAADMRMSVRNVRRVADSLAVAGHLAIRAGDGRGITSVYTLRLQKGGQNCPPLSQKVDKNVLVLVDQKADMDVSLSIEKGGHLGHERRTFLSEKADMGVLQNNTKNNTKNIIERRPIDEAPEPTAIRGQKSSPSKLEKALIADKAFGDFQAAYPKRLGGMGWSAGRKTFDAALKRGVDPRQIISGARAYAADMRRLNNVGTQFVKQPKAWLHQECWADYAEVPSMSAAGPPIDPKIWRFYVERFRRDGAWPPNMGPDPDHPDCQAPAEIRAEFPKRGAAA